MQRISLAMANFFSRLFGKSVSAATPIAPVYDDAGNIFYPRDLFALSRGRVRTDYDMAKPFDRELACAVCAPLAAVLDKLGDMLSRCEYYVTDDSGNELPSLQKYAQLLANPNPLQTFGGFFKQLEHELRLHGFALIKFVRSYKSEMPRALWIIPAELVEIKTTGRIWAQYDAEGVIGEVVVNWGANQLKLEPWEYTIVASSNIFIPAEKDGLVRFATPTTSLSSSVNNWVASMAASHTLLVNGGPKGILHGEATDNFGQAALTKPDEEEIREQFKRKYGLVGKRYPVLVTRHSLRWQPMDFNAAQLRIGETDERCTEIICNVLGVNPNLFSDAKYDNQESAKKAAYQDIIIPDSLRITTALSSAILPKGAKITFDYSSVECLQKSKAEETQTLEKAVSSITNLLNAGLVSFEEARELLADYIDIDPAAIKENRNE